MKIYPHVGMIAVMLTIGACDSLTSLNDNPNAPADVPEDLRLPAIQSNFSYEVIANTAVRIPAHWIQQLAWSGNPGGEDNYRVNESDVNNLWEFFGYTDVLKNSRRLTALAEENGNYAYAGISKIFEAWTLSIMTDLWGAMPYSEAFDPDNPTPAYDSQEEIYQVIFELLSEAREDLQRDNVRPFSPNSDLVYRGNLQRWMRLANTLEARFQMRLSEAPGYDRVQQAERALAALENGFQSSADDAVFQYYSGSGSENPFFQWAIDGKWDTRNQLSEHYVTLLQERNDPRLPIQARPVGAVGNNGLIAGFAPDSIFYQGQPNGQTGLGATNVSSIGAYYSAADAPLTWISYASSRFLAAEATLITHGAGAAQPIYEEAVEAHLRTLGVSEADISEYLASRPDLATVDAHREIMTEKYIANFLDVEAYNDWRRTGYPELEPVDHPLTPISIIPRRFPYPSSELARNPASVQETGIPTGFESMLYPVWWDTNAPSGARTP